MSDWEKRAIDSVRVGAPDPEAIYRTYRGQMKQTAARRLGGERNATLGLSADDIVGDVIADIYAGKVELKPAVADHLGPFLRRVVANHAVTLIRRREASDRARAKQHARDLTDITTDVETLVLAEQAGARMHLLTERERHVIIENVINGRPANDVADELGCSPQNVSQIRRPALRKLFPRASFHHSHLERPTHERSVD